MNIKLHEDKHEAFNDRWEDLDVATGRDGFSELFSHIRMIYARFKAIYAAIPEPEVSTCHSGRALETTNQEERPV
ncbi:hypothetical protein [Pseudomonas frederiksbergensis]|uniref:hypothetical protein n=1 Tax=Pseudomonas frederiksbergensis TaxID=104087 RepID=UPI000A572424|nr:hypothetical protein [Pseudomonas frederiksbergensis]